MVLEKVQKRQALTADEESRLKSGGLIEGRKPNYLVAKSVAQQTDQRASYNKNLAFDKQYYREPDLQSHERAWLVGPQGHQ
jgi:ATP-dependent DNA helicase RecG